jgi:ABC-type uncharacterized transport system auxiliary subunit
VLVALALGGCSLARATPEVRYYTLALAGTPPRLAAPVHAGTLGVDPPYATERIAYRTSPYRLDYYTYHRWAADPRTIVRTAARDYLERAAPAGGAEPYELTGHLRRIEEVDVPGGGRRGELALDLTVTRGGAVVLARSFAESEPAAEATSEAVAAALSRALARILDAVIAELAAGGTEG